MSGIRLGGIDDIRSINELGYELLEQSVSAGIPLDDKKFRMLVASLIAIKLGNVWVVVDDDDKPQGFLLGLVEDLFYSRQRYATDLAVYVRDGYRHLAPRLFREFIKWAKSKPRVVQITLGLASGIGDPDRVGRMYEKLGLFRVGGIYSVRV